MAKVINLVKGAGSAAAPHIEKFMYYAKVELIPPKPSEIPAIFSSIKKIMNTWKSGQWKEFTMKEVLLNTMVATEVALWFCFGEIIGRRRLIGYPRSV